MSNHDRVIVSKTPLRRSHRKARTGCAVCKRRRIKCDEGKPGCQKCRQFGVDCSYSQLSPGMPDQGWTFLINGGPGPHQGRGRPRSSNWSTSTLTLFKSPSCPSTSRTFPPYSPETIQSYRLLFDCLTWSGDAAVVSSREDVAAKVLHPVILDFCRCSIASHLARLQPQQQSHFQGMARRLSSSGIRGLVAMLPSVDVHNCQAVFAAAVLVSITTLAYGPQPGEYLLFCNSGFPLWLGLFQGIKSILGEVGVSQVFSGPLSGFLCRPEQVDKPYASRKHLRYVDWVDQFIQLRTYVETSDDLYCTENLQALGSLQMCYEAIWGRPDGTCKSHTRNQMVFIWIYYLRDDFVQRLQEKKPIPLLIFAYFTVPMKTLGNFWFISGWPDHILSGVRAAIDEAHHSWLQWPLQILKDMG
ncbi:unnamed protein product [Clonostachys chloroleuca]|uniref:Zn(2)-C6 fungal-type domain-containing protein n=1 Tax=Clonostachys chloroleuca TaxID=1926264 RepID=A0AA35PXF0_9HYPO|nr:unnamed protein product [Clonostachys chloroleuca]